MPLEITVKEGQQTTETMGSFDDLEDALTEFNESVSYTHLRAHETGA